MKILVAVDGSNYSRMAIEFIASRKTLVNTNANHPCAQCAMAPSSAPRALPRHGDRARVLRGRSRKSPEASA